MSGPLVVGATDPMVMWCAEGAIMSARSTADRGGLGDVGLVVGSPGPQDWGTIGEMERFVAVLGAETPGGAYFHDVVHRAEVVCALESADLGSVVGLDVPSVVTGLPRPPSKPAPEAEAEADRYCAMIRDGLASAEDPADTSTIAIVAGRGAMLAARAVAAWQSGRAVAALTDAPVPEALSGGGALVAQQVLVAYEAADLLSRAAPLRRSLARQGQRSMERMPTVDEVATRILEAIALASAGRNRTAVVSA